MKLPPRPGASFSSLLSTVLSLVFPWKCPGCEKLLPYPESICVSCAARLRPIVMPFCKRCGAPFPAEWKIEFCADCVLSKTPFTRLRSLYYYEGLAKEMIRQAKYSHRARFLRFFAGEMMHFIPTREIDAIVPVPLHRKREWERTYNQAALLAAELGEMLKLPIWTGLTKGKRTVPQSSLSGMARRANLKNVFSCRPGAPKRVLIVDDVCTTGTTLMECARELRRAGAKRVYALTIARVVMQNAK